MGKILLGYRERWSLGKFRSARMSKSTPFLREYSQRWYKRRRIFFPHHNQKKNITKGMTGYGRCHTPKTSKRQANGCVAQLLNKLRPILGEKDSHFFTKDGRHLENLEAISGLSQNYPKVGLKDLKLITPIYTKFRQLKQGI